MTRKAYSWKYSENEPKTSGAFQCWCSWTLLFWGLYIFPTVHGVLKARILKWFAIPFSSGPHSVRPWPAHLGWPHTVWLSFIELDKAVVLVWLDWLVSCEYGFSVSALWCPLATPTVLPWALGISSRLLQQSAAAAPYLGWGVSPHHRPSWPSAWDSSSWPSCATKCPVWFLRLNAVEFSDRTFRSKMPSTVETYLTPKILDSEF